MNYSWLSAWDVFSDVVPLPSLNPLSVIEEIDFEGVRPAFDWIHIDFVFLIDA